MNRRRARVILDSVGRVLAGYAAPRLAELARVGRFGRRDRRRLVTLARLAAWLGTEVRDVGTGRKARGG